MASALPAETITGYDVWHCALPVTGRRDHGIGTVAGTIEVVILRLTGENGLAGFGEASPWTVFTGTPEASYAALARYFRPLVLGRKVSERDAIMSEASRTVVHCTEAKAALDTALLDLAGKCTGSPAWSFLGDKCRDTIPLSCSIASPDFEDDKPLLERLEADGVRIVKLKGGFRDHAFDVERIGYIRSHHPSMAIRLDYNQGLSREQALRQVPDLSGLGLDFIEQPVAAGDHGTMAELRPMIDVPLLADESVFGPEDMQRAIGEGWCDGVSVKIMKAGSLTRAQDVARLAAEAGLCAYGGDMFETGLAHLAGTHMIAATPEITLGCEFYQAKYFLAEDLLCESFPVRDGHVVVPDRPGLGIDPDMEKVQRYAVNGPGACAA